MTERALTERQESALVALVDGNASSYHRKSCPSLLRHGLVRDCGHRRLVRWEPTDKGRAVVAEIRTERLRRLRAGTL
jgi:hypothetical protein